MLNRMAKLTSDEIDKDILDEIKKDLSEEKQDIIDSVFDMIPKATK